MRRIKYVTSNPLSSTALIFQSCNFPGVPRSTRCSVLRDVARVRRAETRPPLIKTRQDWGKKYPQTDFSKVLYIDEMTLNGLDGWGHGRIINMHRAPL